MLAKMSNVVNHYGVRVVVAVSLLVGSVAYLAAPYADVLLQRWVTTDVSLRGRLISSLVFTAASSPDSSPETLSRILDSIAEDERIQAVAICGPNKTTFASTRLWPAELECKQILPYGIDNQTSIVTINQKNLHLEGVKMRWRGQEGAQSAELWILHDLSYASLRAREGKIYATLLLLGIWALGAILFALVSQLNFFSWQKTLRQVLKHGTSDSERKNQLNKAGMGKLADQLEAYSKELQRQSKLLKSQSVTWDGPALKTLLGEHFAGDDVIVVSNRQPYSHVTQNGEIKVVAPASGLVTALEPVVQSCGGTWIAHGSGDADKQYVDANDITLVPPESPAYKLKRIWLSDAELEAYYSGFSNQGMWPLCILAHVRPQFLAKQWEVYKAINQRFADAVISTATSSNPVVLVQDYHLALVPAMVRAKIPNAMIITFWHIPWPSSETFSICPWAEELIAGMLGSSILGFHTESFCTNFTACVDRFIEARIDRERGIVFCRSRPTMVKSYPISIDWDESSRHVAKISIAQARATVLNLYGLPADAKLIVGVDRMDYSKGLIERLRAFELLLTTAPRYIGKLFLIQIASPTRTDLVEYADFAGRVESESQRINRYFQERHGISPVVLKHLHHSHAQVQLHLKSADACIVTSLHDGMNLVAKEFVAVRDDNSGALVLSQFAGACDELQEAFIINPYDTQAICQALLDSLETDEGILQERMSSMRRTVATHNIYAWAGHMLLDAWSIRQRQRIAQLD